MQNLNQLKTEAFYLLSLILQVRDQLNLLQETINQSDFENGGQKS